MVPALHNNKNEWRLLVLSVDETTVLREKQLGYVFFLSGMGT